MANLLTKRSSDLILKYLPGIFLLFTMFLYMILIPPFQNPDEVQHFGEVLSRIYEEAEYPNIESDILQNLWKYKWFVFVGMGQPKRPPEKLKQIKYLRGYELGSYQKKNLTSMFHWFYGLILKPFKGFSLLTLFYLARFLSLLITFGTLIIIQNFLRKKIPEDGLIWLFFLIPQFLMIGTSVNYDVFSIFFGSLFFISIFKLRDEVSLKWILFLNIGLFGSLLSKKVGWIFFIFLVLSVLVIKFNIKKVLYSFIISIWVLIIFSWINYLLPEKLFVLYRSLFQGMEKLSNPASGDTMMYGFFDFVWITFKSFFAKLGWMAFEMEVYWYFLFMIFILLGILGSVIFGTRNSDHALNFYTLFIFLVQIIIIWQWYGNKGMSQGRFLFPLIFLFIYFLLKGIKTFDLKFFPNKKFILKSYLYFMVLSNLYILFVKIIPIYYLVYLSPHRGL